MITIGGQDFNSRAALKRHLSTRLNTYGVEQPVSEDDEAVLRELVTWHDEPDRKTGPGIAGFEVHSNNDLGYKTIGFRIRQTNGHLEHFGYSDVINKPSHRARVTEAFKNEGIEITRKFRRDAFEAGEPVFCFYSGEQIHDIKDAEAVHHSPTMQELAAAFAAANGGWERINVTRTKSISGHRLEDDHLADLWRTHQQEHLDGLRIALPRSKR